MMNKNDSGGLSAAVFQTDGPLEENDLSPDTFVFVFTRGMTKVRVSDTMK